VQHTGIRLNEVSGKGMIQLLPSREGTLTKTKYDASQEALQEVVPSTDQEAVSTTDRRAGRPANCADKFGING
jgi:hypothetical protein